MDPLKEYGKLFHGSSKDPDQCYKEAKELANKVKGSLLKSLAHFVAKINLNPNHFKKLITETNDFLNTRELNKYSDEELILITSNYILRLTSTMCNEHRLMLGLNLLGLLGSDVLPVAEAMIEIKKKDNKDV